MITVAISGLLGAVLGFIIFRKVLEGDKFGIVILTFMFGGIGLGLGILLAAGIGDSLPQQTVVTKETKIVSLFNEQTPNGSFILGTGTVEGKEYYYYFEVISEEKNVEVKYKRGKVEAEQVLIVEEDDLENEGKLIVLGSEFKRDNDHLWGLAGSCGCSEKELHVPKGTIIDNGSFVLR